MLEDVLKTVVDIAETDYLAALRFLRHIIPVGLFRYSGGLHYTVFFSHIFLFHLNSIAYQILKLVSILIANLKNYVKCLSVNRLTLISSKCHCYMD